MRSACVGLILTDVQEQIPEEVTKAMSALAEILYGRTDYDEIYAEISSLTVELVPGCDHAAIAILRGGRELTVHGATSAVAQLAEQIQGELREGPCFDAIVDEAFQMDSDLTVDPTWPAFSARVLAETPVRGGIGYRIRVGDQMAGSLNLFSETPGALDEGSARLGALLAAFASVTLAGAAEHRRAESLREGLLSNRVIGKATGILMVAHGISDEEAFRVLRQASQDLNIKLAQIAARVVEDQVRGVQVMPGSEAGEGPARDSRAQSD